VTTLLTSLVTSFTVTTLLTSLVTSVTVTTRPDVRW
jgi:hypothetical protein